MVFEHATPPETFRRLGGAWRERLITRTQRTESPLTLAAYGSPALTFDIAYDESLFSRTTISAIADHLGTILASLIAQSSGRLSHLEMLTPVERTWLIEGRNNASVELQQEPCVHQLFQKQVRRTPHAIAIDGPGGPISYDELNRSANRLARHLRARGARPEEFVGLSLDASPEAIIAVFAILKSGAAFLPLHPELPLSRMRTMLDEARPALVLTDAQRLPSLLACGTPALTVRELLLLDEEEDDLTLVSTAGDAAYAFYTSGSTGRRKQSSSHIALWLTSPSPPLAPVISPNTTVASNLQRSPATCSFPRSSPICVMARRSFRVLMAGGSRWTSSHVCFDEHRITITGIPSSWWKEWRHAELPTSLRAVIVGMEQVDAVAVQSWKRGAGKNVRMFNAYGPAEACPISTIYEVGSSPWERTSFIPIGKSIANTYTYVLDSEMRTVPAGVSGELYIGGQGVARGYLNSPDSTARVFIDDPFRPGERLFRTGDVAFILPDGNLVFIGRADRQVKIRGFRVELDEIEIVLARHPSVRQCAVVLQQSEPRPLLVAHVAIENEREPSASELRQHLARHLPEHMIPSAFVVLRNMPLTASGKVDRSLFAPLRCGLISAIGGRRRAIDAYGDAFGRNLATASLSPSHRVRGELFRMRRRQSWRRSVAHPNPGGVRP